MHYNYQLNNWTDAAAGPNRAQWNVLYSGLSEYRCWDNVLSENGGDVTVGGQRKWFFM